jgi:hypothetical protein
MSCAVHVVEVVQGVRGVQQEAGAGPERRRLGGTDAEAVPGDAELRPVEPEDLAGDAKLEWVDTVEDDGGDGSRGERRQRGVAHGPFSAHGRILAYIVVPATRRRSSAYRYWVQADPGGKSSG